MTLNVLEYGQLRNIYIYTEKFYLLNDTSISLETWLLMVKLRTKQWAEEAMLVCRIFTI